MPTDLTGADSERVAPRSGRGTSARGFLVRWIVAAIALSVISAGAAWSVARLTAPTASIVEEMFTTATVVEGRVESYVDLNAQAEWVPGASLRSAAVGTVTTVDVEAGQQVQSGRKLFSVDLRPVFIAAGDVPMFRDLTDGAKGPDVEQLQRMLAELGIYSGAFDGRLESKTLGAVRAWQSANGLEKDGVVRAADIIFVSKLPARVQLDPEVISVGRLVDGATPGLKVLAESPKFKIAATAAQAESIEVDADVRLSFEDLTWTATVAAKTPVENGVDILLGTAEGDVCGDDCGRLPVGAVTSMGAQVVKTPTVEGLVVPSAALTSNGAGEVAIVTKNGRRIPVTIVASAQGLTVVEGVESGTQVRVPAIDGSQPAGTG